MQTQKYKTHYVPTYFLLILLFFVHYIEVFQGRGVSNIVVVTVVNSNIG